MPLLDAPAPIDALIVEGEPNSVVAVTFSHPLLDAAAINLANWIVAWNAFEQTVIAAEITAGVVELTVTAADATARPDVVDFSPPPADVVSDTTKPTAAPAFVDFPLHD